MNHFQVIGVTAAMFCLGAGALLMNNPLRAEAAPKSPLPNAKGQTRYFEMRTYTTNPGKMEALLARFRNDTNRLFKKHGMDIIGFWTPTDPQRVGNTLIYILAYPTKEARDKCWAEFKADPEWTAAKAASEKDGVLVSHVDQVFMTPTDFSPIK